MTLDDVWTIAAATMLLVALSAPATAQTTYPSRTIKIVVPVPPGPVLDVLPRMIGERLATRWGQPVIIENRPGGASNIGAEAVAKAEPDGHTLLATPQGPLAISQHMFPKLGFDPAAFVPITVLVTVPVGLVVNPKVPASTFAELIAYAKANPNKLTYGSAGPGSAPHMGIEKLISAAGVRFVHVPYQGLAPAQRDVIAGHIDLMVDALGNSLPHVKDGRLRLLAVTTATRTRELPDIPAASEIVPGFVHEDWFAMVAPPKTPIQIASKLSDAIAETLRRPDLAKQIDDFFMRPVGSSPSETAAFINNESERWRQLIASAGIKAGPNQEK
jgi:tripartite-type tricarboxylate transporter receptor subunit TctC